MPVGSLTPEIPNEISSAEKPNAIDVSSIEADDIAFEQSAEYLDDVLHAEAKRNEEAPVTGSMSGVQAKKQIPVITKDPIIIEVEKILEDGVGAFYDSLPAQAKADFKKKGEETATEISEMVRTMHVKFKRLIILISNWLKTIPGVNRFFLEQEAKIKADRIMQLIEARKHDQSNKI